MNLKKILRLFVSFVLICSLLSFPFAIAEETEEDDESIPTETQEVINLWEGTDADSCSKDCSYNFNKRSILISPAKLDCFMTKFLLSGNTDTRFAVNFPVTFDASTLSERYAIPTVQMQTRSRKKLTTVKLYVVNFPGNRIIGALKNDDLSSLSDEDFETYQYAQEFLDSVITTDMTQLQAEEAIIRGLINRITYRTQDRTGIDETVLMRYQTAAGALVDGYANCMGYTDAFMLVASMAGFEVSRQSGYHNGSGHIWNTILLDDGWHAVDLTNVDLDRSPNDLGDFTYMNMNLTQLQKLGYTWEPASMLHTIAE